MSKVEKGNYGYIGYYKSKKLAAALVLLAMILFIIITLIIMYGDTSRVGVVFAILLSLPFAKYLIAFIMVFSFKSMEKDTYEKVSAALSCEDGLIYDLVLSKYEGMRFYYALCVKNGHVYALVPEKNIDSRKKDYGLWITNLINDGKYEYKTDIFTDVDKFLKKISSSGEANDRNRIIDKYIKERLIELGV